MTRWFKQLDDLLRGDATLMSSLEEGQIDIPVGGLAFVTALMGVIYGGCMGSFGVLHPEGYGTIQILSSAMKIPLLFFLTLVVTFPSLYVFNALVGSRLSMTSVLRLLVAMLGVCLAVLAAFGPIVVFFSLSTDSYSFIKLLNVVLCAVAGLLGLAFLLRTLHRLVIVQEAIDARRISVRDNPPLPPPPPESGEPLLETAGEAPATTTDLAKPRAVPGALDLIGDGTSRRARLVFQIWVVVFSLVGAQMSWVLRPFIGDPHKAFMWFRPRQGNFFEGVVRTIGNLFT